MSEVTPHTETTQHLKPPSVLGTSGWADWIGETTNLRAESVSYCQDGKDLPRLDGVIFLDKRGRLRQPKRSPYLHFDYKTTQTDKHERLYRQWTTVANMLAAEIVKRGIVGAISLPPSIRDARPFQWAGLNVQIRYTFATTLPADASQFHNSIRKRTRKASEAGFVAERSTDWGGIMACLEETENDKKFSHQLNAQSLHRASALMGEEAFRGYVVRAPSGHIVSGGVRLHHEDGTAIDWVQGTMRDSLSEGVNQLIYSYVLSDLADNGASGFDYGGANIPAVAMAKAAWGFPLVPYLVVSGFDSRHAYRTVKSTRQWVSRKRK